MDKIDFNRVKPGYIMARQYFEIWDKASTRFARPKTEYVHYSVLAKPINGRWFSVEQTQTTTALHPVDVYDGFIVRIYSVKDADPQTALDRALDLVVKQVRYERLRGWECFIRLIPSILRYWFSNGFKPVPWDEMPNIDIEPRLNCLSFIRRCYPDVVSTKYAMTPASLEQSFLDGKLILEQEGIIESNHHQPL